MSFKSIRLAAAVFAMLSVGLPMLQAHAQSTTPSSPTPQDVVGTDPVPPPPGTSIPNIVGTDPVPPPPGTTHLVTSVPGELMTLLFIL